MVFSMAELSEHDEQKALMSWWGMYSEIKHIPEKLLFSIPNAGKRSFAVASIMKSEGMRAGVPDLFLAVPKGIYHGLFIEMKRAKGGTLQDSQKEFLKTLSDEGYMCVVCHGWMTAKQCIEKYFNLS